MSEQSAGQVWRAKRAAGGYGGSSPRETMHASLTRWPVLPARSWAPDGE
jgi:hypothetical protein